MKHMDTLSRIATVCLWGTAVLGLLLLIDTVETVVHMAMALLLFITLVLVHTAWEKKAARVTARVLCLLVPVAFIGLFATYCVFYSQALGAGAEVALSDRPLTILAVIGTPLLCWFLPAAAGLAQKGGGYDAWVLRVLYTLLAALIVYCCFGAPVAFMAWHWESAILRYVWVAVTAAGYGLCWFCSLRQGKKKGGA